MDGLIPTAPDHKSEYQPMRSCDSDDSQSNASQSEENEAIPGIIYTSDDSADVGTSDSAYIDADFPKYIAEKVNSRMEDHLSQQLLLESDATSPQPSLQEPTFSHMPSTEPASVPFCDRSKAHLRVGKGDRTLSEIELSRTNSSSSSSSGFDSGPLATSEPPFSGCYAPLPLFSPDDVREDSDSTIRSDLIVETEGRFDAVKTRVMTDHLNALNLPDKIDTIDTINNNHKGKVSPGYERAWVGLVPVDARYAQSMGKWDWVRIRHTCAFFHCTLLVTLLCVSIGLLIQMPRGSDCDPVQDWYEEGTSYEVFVPSFRDTSNNGIGDVNGVIEALPYIKSLGVRTIHLSGLLSLEGYAVPLNMSSVAAPLGTNRDIRLLAALLHERDMFLTIDVPLVDNRTGLATVDLFRVVPDILKSWIKLGVDGFAFPDLHNLKITLEKIQNSPEILENSENSKKYSENLVNTRENFENNLENLENYPENSKKYPENMKIYPDTPKNNIKNNAEAPIFIDNTVSVINYGKFSPNQEFSVITELELASALRFWRNTLDANPRGINARILIVPLQLLDVLSGWVAFKVANSVHLIDAYVDPTLQPEQLMSWIKLTSEWGLKGPIIKWRIGGPGKPILQNLTPSKQISKCLEPPKLLGLSLLPPVLPGTATVYAGDEIDLGTSKSRSGLLPTCWIKTGAQKPMIAKPNCVGDHNAVGAAQMKALIGQVNLLVPLRANGIIEFEENGDVLKSHNFKLWLWDDSVLVVERWYPRRARVAAAINLASCRVVADISRLSSAGRVIASFGDKIEDTLNLEDNLVNDDDNDNLINQENVNLVNGDNDNLVNDNLVNDNLVKDNFVKSDLKDVYVRLGQLEMDVGQVVVLALGK